jgi:hypothetical protein
MVALVGLSLPARAEAETVVAHVSNDTALNAYAGTVVWSSYDATIQRYRLTAYTAGFVTTLPIRPSKHQFDVDLGPDGAGRLTVVYSRCRHFAPTGEMTRALGCDIYRYTFATKGEQKLRKLSLRSASEVLPSIWGNRVAFARTYERRSGIARYTPRLFVGDLRSGRTRELRGGTRGYYDLYPDGSLGSGGPGPTSIDLRGERVAYDWQFLPSTCEDQAAPDANASELWLDGLSGGHLQVEKRCPGNAFSPVALGRRDVFYVNSGSADDPYGQQLFFRRFSFADHRRYSEFAAPSSVGTAYADGQQIYLLAEQATRRT